MSKINKLVEQGLKQGKGKNSRVKSKKREPKDLDKEGLEAPDGFPSEIRILNQTWQVVYTPNVAKDEHLLGSCSGMFKEIRVDSDQSLESMRETLLHEIFHAYVYSMFGVTLKDELEELAVQLAAVFFLDFVRANGELPFWEED